VKIIPPLRELRWLTMTVQSRTVRRSSRRSLEGVAIVSPNRLIIVLMQRRNTEFRKAPNTTFFTIGYQAHSLESLICSLNENGVQTLIDVRQNPCSRKAGFSKRRLQDAITQAGMKYLHNPGLGTPPRIRDMYRSTGDIVEVLAEYDRHLSSNMEAVESLAQMALSTKVCLLCLEQDHNMCHRGIIARKLCEMTRWKPIHLI